jgi:Flp pilus assembly protein TadD
MRVLAITVVLFAAAAGAQPIAIDYPAEGTIFPPEITAPTFLWHDRGRSPWRIEVAFGDGAEPFRTTSRGGAPPAGEIDPRAVAATNRPPEPGPVEKGAHAWKPGDAAWAEIKRRSAGRTAVVSIAGAGGTARVRISTSKDPVGAPIFYRDVPLMPAETEKGSIQPLPSTAIPLVGWRLRDIGQASSRLLLEKLPTCANCHSFSRDGRTIGMDVDGPENDKGTYAIAAVEPRTSIRTEDVITWNAFPGRPEGQRTIGFMSQVSPDGRYAVSTVNESLYVANFTDYRFLQVFYPTRGILAWYDRQTKRFAALPGADDPRYVHANAVWSPDGSYLVFARAEAAEPYPSGRPLATYAGDPNEVPMRYDLYRIPFNGGRGGKPEPVRGASANGMSNSFPKVSPDGKWIVWVQSRNGQLMRPDGRLFLVPAAGGAPRLMRCNTPLMNSWHSFSPNGRWMVFSSKSRSPYTRLFLTHIDEEGNDSPAILIENATAANRAANIPEFVNVAPEGFREIEMPAAEFYRRFDRALSLQTQKKYGGAVEAWREALVLDPEDPKAHANLGAALASSGSVDDAIAEFRRAVQLRPGFGQAHYNLGGVLARIGSLEEAIASFRRAAEMLPSDAEARHELGVALVRGGHAAEGARWLRRAVEIRPGFAAAHNDLGIALLAGGDVRGAEAELRTAISIDPGYAEPHYNLGVAAVREKRWDDGEREFRLALSLRSSYAAPAIALGEVAWARGDGKGAAGHWLAAAWVLAVHPNASARDGRKAVELAERAMRAGGENVRALEVLAAAYAEAGRFDDAVRTATRGGVSDAAERYRRGVPHRDASMR